MTYQTESRTVDARYSTIEVKLEPDYVDGGWQISLNADADRLPSFTAKLDAAAARTLASHLEDLADENDRRDIGP